MSSISLSVMKDYLSKSIATKRVKGGGPIALNQNKLNGLLAEIDFRNYLENLGFGNRVSVGGWIARRVGDGEFGHRTVVFFPETLEPEHNYQLGRGLPTPSRKLHTICATFHQIGIHSYYCSPIVNTKNSVESIEWNAVQLGIPEDADWIKFPNDIEGFSRPRIRHNYLTYNTDVSSIPALAIPDEFSKEHARISFRSQYLAEISDVDGIFWGQQVTYPVEIKEKTVAHDRNMGYFFGIDLGPFVKLAYYAAKRGNLHSVFIVREIDNVRDRSLVNWWFITFDVLAQFASWVPVGGGTNMLGGASTTVKIPRSEFRVLNAENLARL